MPEPIIISPVTRIEGHAKISIYLDSQGEVDSAQFHVVEFRGFEKFCLGRPFYEMPGLMARICGICPVSHVLASSKAGDALLGVAIPEAAELQRRVVNLAQILQSHALSFFHLSSPDLLLGFDSDPVKRNVFGLIEKNRELARRGIRLRQFGQRIIEMVGGKRIHPTWSAAGGVLERFPIEQRDEILSGLPEALETVEIGLTLLKKLLDTNELQEEVEAMGNFPSLHLGLVTGSGGLELYDGVIRIVDAEGNIVADHLNPQRYFTYLGEASEEWSYMKFPYYKPLGYPGGMYRVGPLSRLNCASGASTPRADKELREFKQRFKGCANHSFAYHLARVVEMMFCVEKLETLLANSDLMGERVRAQAGLNRLEGVGVSEAPRGTLFHHYHVDSNGLMKKANLLIATAQNNLAINKAVEQTARRFVNPNALTEGMLNRVEHAVRCYDPCLSCSTHALGQMPMLVEFKDPSGRVVKAIRRGA